jgi:NAD(P)H-dependent FMN reductase
MTAHRILAFAGSTRRDSFNRRLLTIAVGMARKSGLDVDHVELSDYPMPIFNEDLEVERGQDASATKLRHKLERADGLMLACPEYNSSITPLMKNVIDWMSRAEQGGSGVEVYSGKRALLLGASPGRLGGRRALATVADILGNIGVEVMDDTFSLPGAADAFAGGELADELHAALEERIRAFERFMARRVL